MKEHSTKDTVHRLWAPWRMEYILRGKQAGCFICDMIHADRDREHLLLKRGEHAVLIMNRYPYNNGHLMVCPYRHIEQLHETGKEERRELMDMTADATECLKRAVRAQGYNVGINLGDAAGAGLKEHLHIHIVPRWAGDTNFMPVTASTKVIPQSLDELYKVLMDHL